MKLEFIRPALKYLPEIKIPQRKVAFKEKLIWTSVVLCLFYTMSVIYPYGITPETLASRIKGFEHMTMIFASSIGTLTSVGIGPIVTSSIILQLLVGAEMIDVDLKTKEGKALFQGTQKILTVFIAIFEAGALVFATNMVEGTPLRIFTIFQISMGSVILMYMDEVVSKWGIGSGISLFIAGGVSKEIITAAFNPLKGTGGFAYSGYIINFFAQMSSGNMNLLLIMPILATVLVFFIVVFGEAMRIEIPLSYGSIRGVGGRIPLRFFYVSNIPVILAAALLMNLRMWTNYVGVDAEAGIRPETMTVFQNIVYQIHYYITLGNLYGVLQPDRIFMLTDPLVFLHLIIYLLVFCGLCVLFGTFWVQTTNLDSESMAKQIHDGGMKVPGFRPDIRIIKGMLDKYIPQLTIISSIGVGLLATFADLLGAVGSGTGILLTVGIIYRMYEDIQKEQMADMSPMFRRFMGKA
jgi:preprotein translocase subunit SecY